MGTHPLYSYDPCPCHSYWYAYPFDAILYAHRRRSISTPQLPCVSGSTRHFNFSLIATRLSLPIKICQFNICPAHYFAQKNRLFNILCICTNLYIKVARYAQGIGPQHTNIRINFHRRKNNNFLTMN